MGRAHALRLVRDPRCVVASLYDADPAAAERLRRELARDAVVFGDFAAFCTQAAVDAVIISTPTRFHFEQTSACLDRGWPVLCEKPLADRREAIVALIERCWRGGPPLMVGYQRRFWANYRRLREELQSGRWGNVRSIVSHNAERWAQTIDGTWRNDPQLNPGGFVGDAGSHKIDAVFFATGLQGEQISAVCDCRDKRVEIVAFVQAVLSGGVPCQMSFVGDASGFVEDLHIYCERGDLLIRDWRLFVAEQDRRVEVPVPPEHYGRQSLSNPTIGFVDHLLCGRPNDAPPECALAVFDFTDSLLRSARQHGRTLPVGPCLEEESSGSGDGPSV